MGTPWNGGPDKDKLGARDHTGVLREEGLRDPADQAALTTLRKATYLIPGERDLLNG